MTNIEYSFYNGEYNTSVNRGEKTVTMYERGGWGRSYHLTFKELLKYAKEWDTPVDLKDSDQTVAQAATNIMLANHCVEHGLDPYRYVPRTNKITDPRDRKTIEKFNALFEKYDTKEIMAFIEKNNLTFLTKLIKNSDN